MNGAKQLGIDGTKGSIEVGKDADFLVFDKDLLTAEHEGFSYTVPRDVFFCGRKVN
ncbi:MAG: amidohydrolase family protein [Eubacteriales bacterium]|nr:amidohydrolase family protein [Eubacteriales bacterium]